MYCREDGPSAVKCYPQYAMSVRLCVCSISWTPDRIYVVFNLSDFRHTFQVKVCAQLQGNFSATTAQLQGNYKATPGQLQRTTRATLAQRQGHSWAISGQPSATLWQLQRNARAITAKCQGNSRELQRDSLNIRRRWVFRINLQKKICALFVQHNSNLVSQFHR